jgi:hypothetical protein
MDYQTGHEPTDTDESNAIMYASMNQARTICLSDPVNYVWKEAPVLGYPCPEGLTCYSGTCEFTKQGCANFSSLPYFDCKRKAVPCSFGNEQETCQMCDWDIEPSELTGLPCPVAGDPALTDADAAALGSDAVFCRPGDDRFNKSDKSTDLCRPSQSEPCPGLPSVPTPYTLNGQQVPCSCDDDCLTNGAGGSCMLPPSSSSTKPTPVTTNCGDKPQGMCYPPAPVYTEWREGFTSFNGAPQEDTCVATFAAAKQWCEMPWTHYTTASDDGKSADPPCWKTQFKQPFYYRQEDGKCYITKSYCENNLGNGGFNGSFGDGHDYWVFNTCTTPQGTGNEIQAGYDCCTSLGTSFAQFFFGKTLPAEFDNLVNYASKEFTGNSPDTYCSGGSTLNNPSTKLPPPTQTAPDPGSREALAPLITFLSDERLKENIQMKEENACGMGIHSYYYTWSKLAKQLYGKPDGVMTGLLIRDLERVFPDSIRTTEHGYKVFAHIPALMPQWPDVKSIVYACVIAILMGEFADKV